MFLKNRVQGRSKIQDVWDAAPYKVVRRLDTGNTRVVVPLVATTAEEEKKLSTGMTSSMQNNE